MYKEPDLKDKFLCAIFYVCPFLAVGSLLFYLVSFTPLLYFMLSNAKKWNIKDFVKYHCLQAALLNMIIFFLPDLFNLLASFLLMVLDYLVIFENSVNLLTQLKEIIISLYYVLIRVLAVYAMVWTLRGKYTYIPPISQAVNQLLR
jgi:hypothetical protein